MSKLKFKDGFIAALGFYAGRVLISVLFVAVFVVFLLVSSCSVNVPKKIETENEHDAKVNGDVKIEHEFKFDLSTFREVCEAEYADVEPEAYKEELITICQAERLQEFLDLLASLAEESESEEE